MTVVIVREEPRVVAITLGAAVMAAGAFLPWAASSQDQTNDDDVYGFCGGPGWMGGRADGMMHRYGGGPVGGYGLGMRSGMMRDYAMGAGAAGGPGLGMLSTLDLSESQRTQVNKIGDDLRREHWVLMGKIHEDRAKLRDLESASEPDPKAVGAVYADMASLRQQMIEGRIQAVNHARALLTSQQRQQLDSWRRGRTATGPGLTK
jgi:Spy/CpxP family protein refolding chaperone